MLDRLKKIIFRVIPPSRRFMDRKMRECEESVYNMLSAESSSMSTLLEDMTIMLKNNQTIMLDSIDNNNQQHISEMNQISEILEKISKHEQQYEYMIRQFDKTSKEMNEHKQQCEVMIRQLCETSKEINKNHIELLEKIQLQNIEIEKIKSVQNDIEKYVDNLESNIEKSQLKQDDIFNNEMELIKDMEHSISKNIMVLSQSISDLTDKFVEGEKQLSNKCNDYDGKLALLGKVEEENIWANVFHDVIKDSVWLQNKAFAPGRWAAGYQMLYVMYRIMDSVKPKKILELGLGQTTRMIAQYSGYYNAEHQVVEHDPKWIEFFATTYKVPDNVRFVNLDTITDKYLDDEAVIMYKGFEEKFKGQKFDFICIDAPLGGKAIKYARIDILNVLPDCLEEDFVLLIDDTERKGENNTIKLIQSTFDANDIKYVMKRYDGRKSSTIFTTDKYSFLTSL